MSEVLLVVEVGCVLCRANKDFERGIPTVSAFEYGAGIGFGLRGTPDPLPLCERHEVILRFGLPKKPEGNWGCWATPPKKGTFHDLSPRFQVVGPEGRPWKSSKEEAEQQAALSNDCMNHLSEKSPYRWHYEAREVPDDYVHPEYPQGVRVMPSPSEEPKK